MHSQLNLVESLVRAQYLRGAWGMPKDALYSPMSVEFVDEAMGAWVESLPPALIVRVPQASGKSVAYPRWEKESGDCDNLIFDLLAYLSRCMWVDAVTTGKPRGNAEAGAFYFQVEPGNPASGHAIGWFIDHAGNAHHVDPGIRKIDHLTKEQLATIYGGEYA